jgi:hypothetical protein
VRRDRFSVINFTATFYYAAWPSGLLLVSGLILWSLPTDLRAPGAQPAGGRGAAATTSAASQLSVPVPLTGDFVVRNFEVDSSLGPSYPSVIRLKIYAPGKGQLPASYSRRDDQSQERRRPLEPDRDADPVHPRAGGYSQTMIPWVMDGGF